MFHTPPVPFAERRIISIIDIAICEDEPIHNQIVQEIIRGSMNHPFKIHTYSSAKEFRGAMFSEHKEYDLIIMDIELGDDSGIALSREINNDCPETQVIFISQYLEYVSDVYETEHIFFVNKKKIGLYLPIALEKALNKIHLLRNLYFSFTWHNDGFKILQKNILYMERILRKTEIHTAAKTYTTSDKLSAIEKRLVCHKLNNYYISFFDNM